ncbi:MAG TPA: zinc metallopeptidase [Coriobacteriia bacterium]|nr:zinc metallopeptidase [Coriobacteriia bacterium]
MFFDPLWLMVILVSTGIGFATQGYINSTFRKWSQVPIGTGLSGAEVARRVLDANGLQNVPVQAVAGNLTDHYDPRSRTLALSASVYGQPTVAAAGVAAHEAGHAIQHSQNYVWGSVRTAIVPAVNIGSKFAFPAILLGVWLQLASLAWIGVLFYAGAVLFQVVTLPVEFDASKRALGALSTSGAMSPEQVAGARQVLTAAALTYVGAALISVIQLLYFIGLARRSD